ncbi:MAG: TIGR00725 family protein [Deltaproteobacteria bacterium]|nr:TIGR00725 family protein [Deltaproteobacteria bacterium]MBW2137491.1 TIGR00725 family protein [Deltaproteobacteria bacterium]
MKADRTIGVIGAGTCSEHTYEVARQVGLEIAKRGWDLVCGGLGGVMEGAARGCMEGGGRTIGLLPGPEKEDANPYIEIPIATGLGEGRNLLLVRTSDLLIAIAGGYGTLSEIALALKIGHPVVGLDTWRDIDGVRYVESPFEAIRLAETILL